MGLETKIKTICGDFRSASNLVEGTWQSSADVTKDRIAKTSLRKEGFYTNNHALYDIADNDAFLYFGSKDNSIFRKDTIEEAFRQLTSKPDHYYRPPKDDVAKAKQSSLKLRISDLELKFDGESDISGYVEVDTSDLTGTNFKTDAQRRFAEAVYGSMKQDARGASDYGRAMQMLNNKGKGIETVRIYSLRRKTVLEDAKDGAVARACWLYNFITIFDFIANVSNVYYIIALRGVSSVAEGAAHKQTSFLQQVYRTISKTSDEIAAEKMTPPNSRKIFQHIDGLP